MNNINNLESIINILIIIAIIFLFGLLINIIFNNYKRKCFEKEYGIKELPKSIKVQSRKDSSKNRNYYIFSYPYWYNSKKDGTADLRIKNNRIIWPKNFLYIKDKQLISNRPYDLLDIIRQLRLHNIPIDLSHEEQKKYQYIYERKRMLSQKQNIELIIQYYSVKPTEFEKLCADLFISMGYKVKLTPPTNDGGYDIILSDNGKVSIVECKCYALNHKIGRPAIQKLVGANYIVQANEMIFITTSDFTTAAITYAKEANVKLIDGVLLINLLNQYVFNNKEEVKVSINEWQFNLYDMRQFVPEDIYNSYFI